MRQSSDDQEQVHFREILLHLRDARLTETDWEYLMTRTAARVPDSDTFKHALHLYPTVEAVVTTSPNSIPVVSLLHISKLFTVDQMRPKPPQTMHLASNHSSSLHVEPV